jgi:hypothetical protein
MRLRCDTAVPEQGFAPAKTLGEARVLAATGADICGHAAKHVRDADPLHYIAGRGHAVNILMNNKATLCGVLMFCIDAESFGEPK